jgi:glutamyl/glutaminyl-tRNA synthetase
MLESGELNFFYKKPELIKEKLIFKNTSLEKISENLEEVVKSFQMTEEDDFTKENIKTILMELADKSDSRGEVLHPVRFALSGLDKSPDPFVISDILGKEETIARLNNAIKILKI